VEVASITILFFGLFSALRVVSYVPQIRKVALDTNGATAISYSTWSLWTCANIATALYAAVNLQDIYLSTVSAIYAVCCIVVILLTVRKRRQLLSHKTSLRVTIDREREAAARAVRITVQEAAVALAANTRPHFAFEQDLGAQVHRMLWCDLMSATRPRGTPKGDALHLAQR